MHLHLGAGKCDVKQPKGLGLLRLLLQPSKIFVQPHLRGLLFRLAVMRRQQEATGHTAKTQQRLVISPAALAQARQDDAVELKAFGLVDGHHLHRAGIRRSIETIERVQEILYAQKLPALAVRLE